MGICKQCKQLFYIELQNKQFIENRSTYKLYNSIIRRGLRACARSARNKDLYSYYIGGKSLCIFMR